MKKNNVIIFGVVMFIILLFIVCYFVFIHQKIVLNNNDFKKIYDNKENIKAYVTNLQYEERNEITKKDDIINILEILKNEKIKSVKKGDEILGGNYSIVFVLDEKENVINIFDTQISINGRSYYTTNNIKSELKEIIDKYIENGINN